MRFKSLLVAAAVLLLGAPVANAGLMLRVTDVNTGYSETINDGDADGVVSYFNMNFGQTVIGDLSPSWTITSATGLADPAIGDSYTDQTHLNSFEVSGGNGTLRVMLTRTGLTSAPSNWAGWLGGTTMGLVDFQLYGSDANTAFGLDTAMYDSGAMGGAFADTFSGDIMFSGPYSLTMIATITHSGAGQVTSFDYHVTVPAPGVLSLLGAGLICTGMIGRRRRKIAA